jgi:hypothetical protein
LYIRNMPSSRTPSPEVLAAHLPCNRVTLTSAAACAARAVPPAEQTDSSIPISRFGQSSYFHKSRLCGSACEEPLSELLAVDQWTSVESSCHMLRRDREVRCVTHPTLAPLHDSYKPFEKSSLFNNKPSLRCTQAPRAGSCVCLHRDKS